MKNVTIKNKQNQIISDLNLYDDPTEFIQFNIANKTWGKPERIVRERIHSVEEFGEMWMYPDGAYLEEDVLETIPATEQLESMVRLKADYTIEINDYKKVPKAVTRRQAKQALLQAGLLSTVETYIASAPQNIQIDWYDSQEIQRNWSTLSTVTQALNLTEDQVDDLFILAESL